MLQCVAACCRVLQSGFGESADTQMCALECGECEACKDHTLRCSVLQCVAVCCSVLHCKCEECGDTQVCALKIKVPLVGCTIKCGECEIQTLYCSVLQRVAVCCSVLQCVAVCCSVSVESAETRMNLSL